MQQPLIEVSNLSLQFPIIGVNYRSLKRTIIHSFVGGTINDRDNRNNIISIKALDNIAFKLFEGDRVGLVGHNGSGKSSLLKVLAGVYSPTSGQLLRNGSIASMLDITLGLNHDATGIENIKLRGLLMGLSPSLIRSLTEEIIEFSELGPFINLPLYTYSTGMAMRLAFSIATSVTADIILLDEWLSVGDSDFSKKAKQKLNTIISNSKLLIIASHDQELINSLCNKIINLHHGKISSITTRMIV
jgi:lipopolysaccharide transport system ATP-binding protein